MPIWIDYLISGLLLLGSLFTLIGAIGLIRLPDFYMRLHGPTKATTLGAGSILIASIIYFSNTGSISLHELLIAIFLFITAPVSAHMLAKAAAQQRLYIAEQTRGKPWDN